MGHINLAEPRTTGAGIPRLRMEHTKIFAAEKRKERLRINYIYTIFALIQKTKKEKKKEKNIGHIDKKYKKRL